MIVGLNNIHHIHIIFVLPTIIKFPINTAIFLLLVITALLILLLVIVFTTECWYFIFSHIFQISLNLLFNCIQNLTFNQLISLNSSFIKIHNTLKHFLSQILIYFIYISKFMEIFLILFIFLDYKLCLNLLKFILEFLAKILYSWHFL